MLLGTFFTLVILPSMYLALASKHTPEAELVKVASSTIAAAE